MKKKWSSAVETQLSARHMNVLCSKIMWKEANRLHIWLMELEVTSSQLPLWLRYFTLSPTNCMILTTSCRFYCHNKNVMDNQVFDFLKYFCIWFIYLFTSVFGFLRLEHWYLHAGKISMELQNYNNRLLRVPKILQPSTSPQSINTIPYVLNFSAMSNIWSIVIINTSSINTTSAEAYWYR